MRESKNVPTQAVQCNKVRQRLLRFHLRLVAGSHQSPEFAQALLAAALQAITHHIPTEAWLKLPQCLSLWCVCSTIITISCFPTDQAKLLRLLPVQLCIANIRHLCTYEWAIIKQIFGLLGCYTGSKQKAQAGAPQTETRRRIAQAVHEG